MTGTPITAVPGSPADAAASPPGPIAMPDRCSASAPWWRSRWRSSCCSSSCMPLAAWRFRDARWRPVLAAGTSSGAGLPAPHVPLRARRVRPAGLRRLRGHPRRWLHSSSGPWASLAAGSANRWRVPLALVAAAWLLMVVDGVLAGRLQFDTPFGYSPITAARFAGMGNLGFALAHGHRHRAGTGGLAARGPVSACSPTRCPRRAPTALLGLAAAGFAVSVVVDGLPSFGADVGGVLALLPALAVTWLRPGRRAGRRGQAGGGGRRRGGGRRGLRRLRPVAPARIARPTSGASPGELLDGDAGIIIERKISSNLHVIANVGVIVAVGPRRWSRSSPRGARRPFRRLRDRRAWRPSRRRWGDRRCGARLRCQRLRHRGAGHDARRARAVVRAGRLRARAVIALVDAAGRCRGGGGRAGGRSGCPWPTRCCCGPNYRGEQIPTAIGCRRRPGLRRRRGRLRAARRARRGPTTRRATSSRDLVLLAMLGFALLGLFDDLAGSGHRRGFAGHAAALRSGQLTTGMLKLVGGALVAVAVVSARALARPQAGWLLLDAALVALAANLANLLDRAPGRTTKVASSPWRRWPSARGRGPSWPVRRWPSAPTAGLLGPELRGAGDARRHRRQRRRGRRGRGCRAHARPGRGAWACSSSCSC